MMPITWAAPQVSQRVGKQFNIVSISIPSPSYRMRWDLSIVADQDEHPVPVLQSDVSRPHRSYDCKTMLSLTVLRGIVTLTTSGTRLRNLCSLRSGGDVGRILGAVRHGAGSLGGGGAIKPANVPRLLFHLDSSSWGPSWPARPGMADER